jgi:hypothetical protein
LAFLILSWKPLDKGVYNHPVLKLVVKYLDGRKMDVGTDSKAIKTKALFADQL